MSLSIRASAEDALAEDAPSITFPARDEWTKVGSYISDICAAGLFGARSLHARTFCTCSDAGVVIHTVTIQYADIIRFIPFPTEQPTMETVYIYLIKSGHFL